MLIETRAVGPFFKNGYLLGCTDTRESVIVDPGDEIAELLDIAAREQLVVRYILLTHAHMDHLSGAARAKSATGAPIGLHRGDLFLYETAVQQGQMFGYRIEPPPPPDFFYDGEALPFGSHDIHVHHTPGHSPGGVCLQVDDGSAHGRRLFVGDTLFAGSIGRTDLPGGDYDTLMRSIRTVLFALGDDAIVHSGHGPDTTIGHERRTNPFLV